MNVAFLPTRRASIARSRLRTVARMTLAGLTFGAVMLAYLPPSYAVCFVAYLHGSGENFGEQHTPDGDDRTCGHTDLRWKSGPDWLGPPDAPLPVGWDIATMGDPRMPGNLESYWSPTNDAELAAAIKAQGLPGPFTNEVYSLTWSVSRQARDDPEERCLYFRVGYNGWVEWWHDGAAGVAARRLAQHLDLMRVPDGQLIIVTHSMGGLVARHILNNASPHSMGYQPEFERVARATRHVATIQAPHAGSTAADALFGRSSLAFPNDAASALVLAGERCRDRRSESLTTDHILRRFRDRLLGDEGRTVPIYTVAGWGTDARSGTGFEDDWKTHVASQAICYEKGVANNWGGGVCGRLPCFKASLGAAFVGLFTGGPGAAAGNFLLVQGTSCEVNRLNFHTSDQFDGLVDTLSAHGDWPDSPATRAGRGPLPLRDVLPPALQGPRGQFLTIRLNHNHGRYNVWHGQAVYEMTRSRRGVAIVSAPLGYHIGTYGMRLPESGQLRDPGTWSVKD